MTVSAQLARPPTFAMIGVSYVFSLYVVAACTVLQMSGPAVLRTGMNFSIPLFDLLALGVFLMLPGVFAVIFNSGPLALCMLIARWLGFTSAICYAMTFLPATAIASWLRSRPFRGGTTAVAGLHEICTSDTASWRPCQLSAGRSRSCIAFVKSRPLPIDSDTSETELSAPRWVCRRTARFGKS